TTGLLLQTVTNAVVEGNLIGTNAAGNAPLPNDVGVGAFSTTNTRIGGTAPGAGNVISGNTSFGIRAVLGSPKIQGNFIGTDAEANVERGSTFGIELNSPSAIVGPDTPGGPGANVIAFNNGIGLNVAGTSGGTIRGNSIHDNKLLGIDIGSNGVTANDV